MRFTISREKLQEGLAAVASSVPTKTTLPVLSNILIETTDRGIRLSGTDLDIAVSTEVLADVEMSGAVTIPAKKLSEISRELLPAPVRIAAANEQRVTLECGKSKFKLLGIPRDEFPTFPAVRFNESWRVRSGELHKLISHTSFAVSTEESRPILNGVLWELRADHMRMVATNGHRLAKMQVPIKSSGMPSADLIVPPKALEQIRRLFPADEELEMTTDEIRDRYLPALTELLPTAAAAGIDQNRGDQIVVSTASFSAAQSTALAPPKTSLFDLIGKYAKVVVPMLVALIILFAVWRMSKGVTVAKPGSALVLATQGALPAGAAAQA